MKKHLILSIPEDPHTHYVTWALKQVGLEVRLINSLHENCPSRTTLYLDGEDHSFASSEWNEAEAAWCRRLGLSLDSGKSSDDDEDNNFVKKEEHLFTKWLIELQSTSSIRWINSPEAEQAAENKFLQLKTAKACGINVPRTLVTANPGQVRSFLKSEGVVVAKSLGPYSWKLTNDKVLAPYATVVDAEQLLKLSDEDISQCVTMYQQRIAKVSDVRMVILGTDVFAYRVIQSGEEYFDYRLGFNEENQLQFASLVVPDVLQKKLVGFMSALKINFASADFAVTENGDFIFLDLNPSGQWMFVETDSFQSHIGQRFCSFFTKGCVDAHAENMFPSITEYRQSVEAKALTAYYEQQLSGQKDLLA